jgi:hypothetical protein
MRASLVQRGRSEGRVSFADELESAEEQDVDDRDVVVLGEGRFERLDDGELDLGSVCRFISPSAWLMHVVTVAESRRLKEKEQFGRRTLASGQRDVDVFLYHIVHSVAVPGHTIPCQSCMRRLAPPRDLIAFGGSLRAEKRTGKQASGRTRCQRRCKP